MQNRSHFPIVYDSKHLPAAFPVLLVPYTQRFQKNHSLHYHNVLELGICLSGSGIQFVNEKIYSFTANTVSVIQEGCIHDSHIIIPTPETPPSQWNYLFIDLAQLGIESHITQSFNVFNKELASLLKMMVSEVERQQEHFQEVFIQLLDVFIIKARRLQPCIDQENHNNRSEMVAEVINYIAQKYHEELTVDRLAKEFNMSIGSFRKMITQNLGISPQQYIIHVRLSMAEQLLRTTTKPILSISEEVGFQTLSSFNRLFKKHFGVAPRSIRR